MNKNNLYSIKVKAVPIESQLENPESCGFGITQKIKIIGIYNPKCEYKIFYNEDESKLLKDFWDYVNDINNDVVTLVGWASKSYDFPLIYQRTIINKIYITNMRFPLISELQNYKNDNLLDAALLWKCGGSKCDSLYQVARTLNYFHDEEKRIAFKEMSDHYEVFYKMYLADISNNNIGKATIFLRDQLKFIWDIADLLV